MLRPTAFALAAGAQLADFSLIRNENIRFVSTVVVSDLDTWPVRIEVHFLAPRRDSLHLGCRVIRLHRHPWH